MYLSMPLLHAQNKMEKNLHIYFKYKLRFHKNTLDNIKTSLLLLCKRAYHSIKVGKKNLTRPTFYGFAVYHFLLVYPIYYIIILSGNCIKNMASKFLHKLKIFIKHGSNKNFANVLKLLSQAGPKHFK